MGISQQIGSSSLSKPGVCTSSTRPATPYEGQMIYETDTDKVLVWNGSAWYANWNLPFGVMALTTLTTNDTATTEKVTITSSSFTAIANRYYKITFFEGEIISTTATTYCQMRIRKGTTTAGTQLASATAYATTYPTAFSSGTVSVITTLSAGAQQVVGTINFGAGTGTCASYATAPAYLLVEDIGVL